jgi:cytochrome c5
MDPVYIGHHQGALIVEMILRFSLALVFALALLPTQASIGSAGQIPGPPIPRPVAKPETSRPSPPVAASRGRMLYENHCTRCHTSVLHVRENRRAVSLKALEGWVRRWSGEEKLTWSEEEIVGVVDYLNRRYYKFPPPGGKK